MRPEHSEFRGRITGRLAIVAAHPDDEVIGAGGHFPQLRDALFIHVTNGAPRNGRDATAFGFASPEDYARARADELAAALALAGIDQSQCREAGLSDQEVASISGHKSMQMLRRYTHLRAEDLVKKLDRLQDE